ncbi:MAG TPA: prepilin-type N-terminal cleavage/methylation domain-containing protein [Candidatus Paceibacterota bacterium]
MTKQTRFGFTLIEIMVATSLFAIVMMIAVGALLSLVEANKRAQAINAVMNNVSAAMETMTRNIRVGRVYHCESTAADVSPETLASVNDCAEFGGLLFAFEPSNGGLSDSNDQTVYRLNGTQIERSLCSGVNQSCAGGTKNGAWIAITAPEIRISSLRFFVKGSPKEDGFQPRVLIVMKGEAPVPGGATTFSIQSTVAQRVLDI